MLAVKIALSAGRYPWKSCVTQMTDNSKQALKVQSSIERHMVKAGMHQDYTRKWRRQYPRERLENYLSQKCLFGMDLSTSSVPFAVVKPDSVSTQTRIVSNSAMRNVHSKLSLNDCMYLGPNALAALLDCLIFWRSVAVAIMMDLRKVYQAIHTSPMELHLRWFFYRRRSGDLWKVFAYTRATFGDVLAGLMLEIAKRKIANLRKPIDPQAAEQLKNLLYIDDGVMGGSREEVNRMRGKRVRGSYTGTVSKILAKGGMSVKFMAVTGSNNEFEEEQLAGKNLGVNYYICTDWIAFTLVLSYATTTTIIFVWTRSKKWWCSAPRTWRNLGRAYTSPWD